MDTPHIADNWNIHQKRGEVATQLLARGYPDRTRSPPEVIGLLFKGFLAGVKGDPTRSSL